MAWSWHLPADTEEHAAHIQLTDAERILLARIDYEEKQHGPRTILEICSPDGNYGTMDPRQSEAYQSLCRFGYLVEAKPRTVRHAAVADIVSPSGVQRLANARPRLYKCCEFAVVNPCVCSESTYCPNPEHRGGCHGTHD